MSVEIKCDKCRKELLPDEPSDIAVFRFFDAKPWQVLSLESGDNDFIYEKDFHICKNCLESVFDALGLEKVSE